MKKELLFVVTASDCDWVYQRGSGNGGQKKNKTSSAVRCVHRASGACGYAEDSRSQHQNKGIAFRRMAESDKFKAWHKIESMKRLGQLAQVEDYVNNAMREENLRVEGKVDGKWEVMSE